MKVPVQTLFVAMVLLASVSCERGAPEDGPRLLAESSLYEPGDRVTVEIRNEGTSEVGYNICHAFLTLEREVGHQWEEMQVGLGPEPDSPCTAQLNLLEVGARDVADAFLPADLRPGTYRITTGIEVGPQLVVLQTDPFEVRG